MNRLLHGLFGLGVTSVRAAGWFETVAVCVCVALRIAAHQRLSPRRGHFRYAQSGTGRAARGTTRSCTASFW